MPRAVFAADRFAGDAAVACACSAGVRGVAGLAEGTRFKRRRVRRGPAGRAPVCGSRPLGVTRAAEERTRESRNGSRLRKTNYMPNDVPHPQLVSAFGFLNWKPPPMSSLL